jgi:amino acid transporter
MQISGIHCQLKNNYTFGSIKDILYFWWFKQISQCNTRNSSYELWFQGLLAFIFIIAGDITSLIDFASFLIWIFYGAAMVALILMRSTKKDIKRPYKVFFLM